MNLGENFTVIIIAFARIASFLFVIPFLSGSAIPRMAKIVVSVGLSLAVVGRVHIHVIQNSYDLFGYLIMQIIIGVTLAKIVEMLMSIPRMAGAIMDIDLGFASVTLFDPTTKQINSILSMAFNVMFVLSFLAFNGVQSLIVTIVRSFDLTETLSFLGEYKFLEFFVGIFSYMLTSAVQIALPVLGATFVLNFVLLIIGRTSPQTQIVYNIFPIKLTLGILFIALMIPVLGDVFNYLNQHLMDEYVKSFNYLFKK